jgi:hypothetical protein
MRCLSMIFNGTRVNACTQVQEKLSSTPEPADLNGAKVQFEGFFSYFSREVFLF